jgi:hypothetical protein
MIQQSPQLPAFTGFIARAGQDVIEDDGSRNSPSQDAVDRNGSRKFRKDFSVKGAKRRLRRSKTLDRKVLSKHATAVAIDGFL